MGTKKEDRGSVGTQEGEASHSRNKLLFQLSQMARGEAMHKGDSSNFRVPRGAGRRNSADAAAQRSHADKVFFRAPLGFPREGTVGVLWGILHEVLMTTAAVEGSRRPAVTRSPRAPQAQKPPPPGQCRLLPGLSTDKEGVVVTACDLWLLQLPGRWMQEGGVWPRKEDQVQKSSCPPRGTWYIMGDTKHPSPTAVAPTRN